MNSPDHLELLIDFSCDHRSGLDTMNAATRPVEQASVFVFVDDRYREDAGLCGQHSGFGWSISSNLEIFLHHDKFTSDRVVDFSNKE